MASAVLPWAAEEPAGAETSPAEARGLEPEGEQRQHGEEEHPDAQRAHRPAHQSCRHPAPHAVGMVAWQRLGRPEHRPSEDGEQRRQEGEAGHAASPRCRWPAAGRGRGRCRSSPPGRVSRATMTVPADAVMDSPTRCTAYATAAFGSLPLEQLLAHAEDEEEAVVGARPEDQDDEEDLGEERDLEQPRAPQAPDERARHGRARGRRATGSRGGRAPNGRSRTAGR